MPSFGRTRTVTFTEHDVRVAEVVVECEPRQQLERLDVAGAGPPATTSAGIFSPG